MEVVWKIIDGFEFYKINNIGEVFSIKRNIKMKPYMDRDEYLMVSLRINNKSKWKKVHRLVAIAFMPNPENKPQVNHKNGIKYDNRLENLEWCTNSENMKHAYALNLIIPNTGESKFSSKLKNSDIVNIKTNPLSLTQKQLSEIYNVHNSNISRIINGKKWKHVLVTDNIESEI